MDNVTNVACRLFELSAAGHRVDESSVDLAEIRLGCYMCRVWGRCGCELRECAREGSVIVTRISSVSNPYYNAPLARSITSFFHQRLLSVIAIHLIHQTVPHCTSSSSYPIVLYPHPIPPTSPYPKVSCTARHHIATARPERRFRPLYETLRNACYLSSL
jgi:hypothetical protein